MNRFALLPVLWFFLASSCAAREPDHWIDLWPNRAPGETSANLGERLPRRPQENPPATRIKNITKPRLAVYLADSSRQTGTTILVFPGGGYNYVVIDKEGSETADWLNPLGVTVCVLHYRTKSEREGPLWRRPLQDGQRAIRQLRHREASGERPGRIGVMGFSAGGQAAALVGTRFEQPSYPPDDTVDTLSARPDFILLIYPWRLIPLQSETLMPELTISDKTPPTFLSHAHDDSATSMSSVLFYAQLKRWNVPAELHVFAAGGHGYGMRKVAGTNIHTWKDRATDWLVNRHLAGSSP